MNTTSYYLNSTYYFFMRWVFHKQYLIAPAPEHNLSFKFKTEDAVGRRMFKTGICEPGITRCFLNNVHLGENDIMLDIGANIGWYSMLFDRNSPASARIYAFEPDPLNYGLLTDNAQRNNARKVTCVQQALSDRQENKTLYLYPDKNRGRHSLLPLHEGKKIQVATTTVDDFMRDAQLDPRKIKFVKIDVEGYEYFVLKGAKNLLPHLPLLHTEYSSEMMRKGGIDPQEFINLIVSYGFQPFIIDAQGELQASSSDQLMTIEDGIDILWKKAATAEVAAETV
ncbi:FkbM family methyltransferase [Hymenobacter sp. ISL-91]|uniref:FkbM family methyltransferase n=1 Tax=Hymenobacter sp. ISL-91 TaxID=2819151 RepID=UPI001BEAC4F8|nr:FkbM family methyltransferase [Hymenobacter sp. ISL-91]MBT2558696.1 FkbM family methyltransferase [Hymenobacter sp. ISL-91]